MQASLATRLYLNVTTAPELPATCYIAVTLWLLPCLKCLLFLLVLLLLPGADPRLCA
jgi:hypothetical protein